MTVYFYGRHISDVLQTHYLAEIFFLSYLTVAFQKVENGHDPSYSIDWILCTVNYSCITHYSLAKLGHHCASIKSDDRIMATSIQS